MNRKVAFVTTSSPHMTDTEQATKDLLALAKDEDISVRRSATEALGKAFPHMTDTEQATKDLLALAKDEDFTVRGYAAFALSSVARHYINKRDFEKASQCFSVKASAFRYSLLRHIKPEPEFYLYEGLSYYYHGRALMSELPKKNPDEYVKNIKKAVSFFDKSINYTNKYTNKSGRVGYESETRSFPICFNIYSAYYEYFLSFKNLDKKRLEKVQSYLDEASKQCKIVGTEKGERIVKVFEKFKETLKLGLEKLEQNEKIQEVNTNGKGIGVEIRQKGYINDLRKELEQDLTQLDNLLNEIIDAPITKKLLEKEKQYLEELAKKEETRRKSFWQRSYDYIKEFWKIIVAIGLILGTIV